MSDRIEEIAEGALKILGEINLPVKPAAECFPGSEEKTPLVSSSVIPAPDRQVLEEILSDVLSSDNHPCIVEPGKPCTGCKGRCSNLGF